MKKLFILLLLFFSFLTINTNSYGACGTPKVSTFGTTNKTSNSALVSWARVSGALSYNVEYRIRNVGASYSLPISTTTTSLQINGLQPSTNYEFIVQTVCTANQLSSFSSSGWFTTLQGTSTNCTVPNLNSFGTRNKTSNSIECYWNSTGAVSYNVQYRIRNSGSNYSTAFNTLTTSIVLTNLQPLTNYEFIVQSVCGSGSSAYSASGWFTTLNSTTTTCAIPGNLSVSNITINSSTLNWSAISGALSYNINYRIFGSTSWINQTSSINSINLTNLTSNSTYEFQVRSVCSAGSSAFATSTFTTLPVGVSTLVPRFDHIVVVIGENTNASSVYGSSSAPYINALATGGAKFTNSFAITHPSQPNYLHLFAGSNQGVTNNNVPSSHFTTPNLARELINAGKTFVYYSDGLPSVGYDGASSGEYRRRHNALANWMGTSNNQVSSSLNQPFTNFPTNFNNLPSVAFVVPDLCNDGHDVCAPYNNRVKQYDAWVENNLNSYKQWCINNNSLLIVTYDEDDGSAANNIITVFYGDNVVPGVYNQTINHHIVLRTIEDANQLSTHAGAAATSTPITYCWESIAPVLKTKSNNFGESEEVIVYPNPTNKEINIDLKGFEDKDLNIELINSLGQIKLSRMYRITESSFKINYNENDIALDPGFYLVKIEIGQNKKIYKKIIVN